MTTIELHNILDNPNRKLTFQELCQVIYELKLDTFHEIGECLEEMNYYKSKNDPERYQRYLSKEQFYSGETNAFQICLDLLEHLEI